MKPLYLTVVLAPLVAALIAGLFGRRIGRAGAHWVTIIGVTISFVASVLVLLDVLSGDTFNGPVYTWAVVGDVRFEIGFLIDRLTALMMVVVTFVSLMVHIYTVGYMADDDTSPGGYQRFFSYISLFTFSMLMLVMANNFLQLFFGWEAVGVVSYFLIGYYFRKPSATYANLKAFIVNRVGDFGFLIGIGLVLAYFGSLDYATVFAKAPLLAERTMALVPGQAWSLMTVVCICLFVGAMGKSAQVPLHVWLPDSMEGPTPISALIHAATMVTAGIFMVTRMSPLFELSTTALSFVLVIGATGAFFMALVAVVMYDIKRVIAYSTLSQLGYMVVGLGVSAFPAAMFHLFTHAFFKALFFLAAGSVIIAMHHEQDMRKMGGLRRYMPITYLVTLIAAAANAALPPFSGFFSKDTVIEAAALSHTPGATYAYLCVLGGAFLTALYSFRLVFFTFHGEERFRKQEAAHGNEPAHHGAAAAAAGDPGHDHDAHAAHGGGHAGHDADTGHAAFDPHADEEHHHVDWSKQSPRESPWVVTLPLVLLAIPSVVAGFLIGDIVYGDYFGSAVYISPDHPVLAELREEFPGAWGLIAHAPFTIPFWLVLAGIAIPYYLYVVRPDLHHVVREKLGVFARVLANKYGIDDFYQRFFADGAVKLGNGLWKYADKEAIDGVMVNGAARTVGLLARVMRLFQTGYIYQYAFTMIIGVVLLLAFWLSRIALPS
jgi:NADH-quinone oxidoreductase subunit L